MRRGLGDGSLPGTREMPGLLSPSCRSPVGASLDWTALGRGKEGHVVIAWGPAQTEKSRERSGLADRVTATTPGFRPRVK